MNALCQCCSQSMSLQVKMNASVAHVASENECTVPVLLTEHRAVRGNDCIAVPVLLTK